MDARLYIGTYAKEGGAGLVPLSRDAQGVWRLGEPVADIRNASYSAYSPRHGLHYIVDEQRDGAIGIWRRDAESWRCLARVSTQGAGPCHIALHPAGSHLAVANYDSGSLTCFRLDRETGLPLGPAQVHRNSGHGPVTDRQEGPHAHCALFTPDGRWLYQTDLGTDEVLAFPVNAHGIGLPQLAYRATPGLGPRHILFTPSGDAAFLVGELSSELVALDMTESALEARQTLSTLPPGYAGANTAAHLALSADGRRVYVSNRGHDSIALFEWDRSGELRLIAHCPSGGASPRHFLLRESEGDLIVANAASGTVCVFPLSDDGRPGEPTACLDVPGAVYVMQG